ncbi:MAG: serine hydrolase [Saprospiraceae bacterium]|nr:serine hydrolase [Saprospiraceae bacterium]
MTTRRNFLHSAAFGTAALGMPELFIHALRSASGADSAKAFKEVFPLVSPESQGISSSAITKFIEEANKCAYEWHSFILLRHGKKIAEAYWNPFEKGGKHTLYSLSKSFTSSAIGMLVDDGLLKVTDKVIDFFPESLPEVISDNLKAMTIHHLLCMNTGHDSDTMPVLRANEDKTWVQSFLAHPVIHAPGSHFLYNTGSTYMQSAIVQKVSGKKLIDFLKPRLFDPLGITDYDWEESPQGINTGGYGLRVSTESIARFGQLYLNEGTWEGKRILSKAWIDEATKFQSSSQDNDSDWGQGYGYQFWRCKPGFYRGDGAYGQYCIVMPQFDAVLAINSESWDMGKSMQIAWDTLLPAFEDNALPEDKSSHKKLKDTIAGLALATKPSDSSTLAKMSGKKMVYKLMDNDYNIQKAMINFDSKGSTLSLDGKKMRFDYNGWSKNKGIVYPLLPEGSNQQGIPFAGSATWIEPQKLLLHAKFVEGIHSDLITLDFAQDGITISMNGSVTNSRSQKDDRKNITGNLV